VKSRTTDAEDISKAYADTTARLANSRRMEARLVKMLEEKDGKVNELLQVERELGRVRGEIETMEAEIRLDDGLVRYATVTIRLRERDLSQGQADRAVLDLSLVVPGGDVPAAVAKLRETLAAAAPEAAILSANVQQSGADGGATTTSEASVEVRAPSSEADAAEAALRALGLVTASTRQETGTDAAAPVRFTVRLLSEAEPVQRTNLVVEVPLDQVEAKAEALKKEAAASGSAGFKVKAATFVRDEASGRAELRLRLPMEGYPALLARLRGEGKVVAFNESRDDRLLPGGSIGAAVEAASPAEIALTFVNAPRLVPAGDGPLAALKKTCAEGAAALGWSLRMIGVAVAFLAPWLVLAAVAGGIVWVVKRRKK